MRCKLKSEILYNAQRADVRNTVNDMRSRTLSADEVIANLENVTDSIGKPDFEKILEERTLLARALDKIPSFREWGLIIPRRANELYTAGTHFINDVIKTNAQAFDFINTLNLDGTLSGNIEDLVKRKNGKYITDKSSAEINNAIGTYLSKMLVHTEKTYVSVTDGVIKLSPALARDVNEYQYSIYLRAVGTLAEASVSEDVNVEEEYEDTTSYLKQGPVVSHINQQIHGAESMKKKLLESEKRDPDRVTNLEGIIANLEKRKKDMEIALTEEELKTYIKKLLKEISYSLENKIHLSPEVIVTYLTTLDLIENAANYDITENRILEFAEINDKDLMKDLNAFRDTASHLKVELNEIAFSSVMEAARERKIGEDFADSEFRTVKNLATGWSQALIKIVGIQHIHNPIIQYLHHIIAQAEVKSSILSTDSNFEIEEKYKKMQKSFGKNTEIFIQRDDNNTPTGRMTDVFTAKYWREARDFYNDWVERMNRAIQLNPVLLFSEDLSAEEKVEAKALRKELNDNLGSYMTEQWIGEAKRLWDAYKAGLKLMQENHSKKEVDAWILENDPVHRLTNFSNVDKKNRGSDKFLIVLPKKYDVDGADLGYYDNNFRTIMANEDAAEFYKTVRKTFAENQHSLQRFDNKLKPPTLAYIGQSIIDNVRRGDYKGAMKILGEDLKKEYLSKERAVSKKYPINNITGEYGPHLKFEVHDIPTEIRRRIRIRLGQDAEWVGLQDDETSEGFQRREDIYESIRDSVAKEVDVERSDDLLQSIVMSNYATQTYIQKKAIETSVQLAQHLIDKNIIKTKPFEKNQESDNKAQTVLKNAVQHYVDVAFYDIRNQSSPTPLGKVDHDNPDKKVRTTRGIINALLTFGRTTVLGWSVKLAFLNLGQQAFSNIMKAAEGTDFGFRDLLEGYKNVASKKKDRNLVDRLFIAGDLAYTFNKRTIHEQSKLWAFAHPMKFQSSAEKVNQGATSLAVMHFQKLTNKKTGETMSMYDALDEDGNLDKDFRHAEYGELSGIDLLATLTVDKIRPVVMKTAGDYISPLLLEKDEWGRLITMFKKFLPEMLMDRFHAREYDYSLKRETEGRLYGLGAAAWQVIKERSFKGVKEDSVRFAAAKAGLAEVIIAASLRTLFLGLAKLSCDTKECREQAPWVLRGLNMLGRLTDDVVSLTIPITLYNQILSPFALQGVVKNYVRFQTDFTDWLIPGGDTGRYKRKGRGYEAGDVKFIHSLESLLPFWRTNVYGIQQISDKLSYDPTAYAIINDDDKVGLK